MDKTRKKLSDAGKRGQEIRKKNFDKSRSELLTKLSSLVNHFELVQAMQEGRSNAWLQARIEELTKTK